MPGARIAHAPSSPARAATSPATSSSATGAPVAELSTSTRSAPRAPSSAGSAGSAQTAVTVPPTSAASRAAAPSSSAASGGRPGSSTATTTRSPPRGRPEDPGAVTGAPWPGSGLPPAGPPPGQRAPLGEQPDRLENLGRERARQDAAIAPVLVGADLADARGAARGAPGARPKAGGAHQPDPLRRDGRPLRGPVLGRRAEPLGHAQHRRERHQELRGAVVPLAADPGRVARDLQVPDTAGERQSEQLRELGRDLAGVGIDGVQPGEDQVERRAGADRGRERPRGGERVGAGEGRITQVDALGGPGRHGLPQHLLGGRRAQRERHATASRGELDALGDRAAAVRVHLQRHVVAHQPAVRAEPEVLGQRDLLDQDGHRERAGHGESRTLVAPCDRKIP